MTSYATPAELRAQIGQTTADATVLQEILDAATESINLACHRPDGFLSPAVAAARQYCGSGTTVQRIDECTSVTKLEVKDSAADTTYVEWATTDYILATGDPERPDFNRLPYTLLIIDPAGAYSHFTSGQYTGRAGFPAEALRGRGVKTVQVTAKWGYAATTPPVVKQACIAQALRWYERAKGGMSDATATGEFGQLFYRRELDPDVARMLVGSRLVRVAL